MPFALVVDCTGNLSIRFDAKVPELAHKSSFVYFFKESRSKHIGYFIHSSDDFMNQAFAFICVHLRHS